MIQGPDLRIWGSGSHDMGQIMGSDTPKWSILEVSDTPNHQ